MPTKPPIHRQQERQAARTIERQAFDRRRYTEHDRAFYGTAAWQRVRAEVLLRDLYQCQCGCRRVVGRKGEAVVDHIIDRRKRPDLALNPSNLRTMAKQCHDRKTAHDHAANHQKHAGTR